MPYQVIVTVFRYQYIPRALELCVEAVRNFGPRVSRHAIEQTLEASLQCGLDVTELMMLCRSIGYPGY